MQVAFNQHQLNLVSCCVYSAARVLGATVPFRRINETITAVLPLQDPALFAQADVGGAGELLRFLILSLQSAAICATK